jgi:hypothetical protein
LHLAASENSFRLRQHSDIADADGLTNPRGLALKFRPPKDAEPRS